MNKQYFTLKKEQFIEFTEDDVFFVVRNEGIKTKLIYIDIRDIGIHEIKEKEEKQDGNNNRRSKKL